MDNKSRHSRFLLFFILTFVSICALAGAFNYIVDPYGLFGSARIPGFNEIKPTAATRVRTSKPYMASAIKPRTVIGGNSRPELGLDPQSPCFTADDLPVFNTGIPGASFYTQTQYVRHAVDVVGARRVLMGVDFFDFLINTAKEPATIDWRRPAQDFAVRLDLRGAETPVLRAFAKKTIDRLGGLFSLEAITDSIATVSAQGDPDAPNIRADGFNPANDYRSIIRHEGQQVLFQQKNRELAATLARPNLGIFNDAKRRSAEFGAVTAFLDWASRRNVEVILFINPYHAHYLASIDISGNWPLFNEWKRELTRVASTHSVSLWDFNTVDAYSTETPPAANDRKSQMEWYWEPAHYRKEVGELMIAKMLGHSCEIAPASDGPGVRLNPETLEYHLQQLYSALRTYAVEKPDEYAALEQISPKGRGVEPTQPGHDSEPR